MAHGKFYFFDCGVFRSLRPAGLLDAGGDMEGAALEGLALQHLRAWIGNGNVDCRVYFWRTRGGSEAARASALSKAVMPTSDGLTAQAGSAVIGRVRHGSSRPAQKKHTLPTNNHNDKTIEDSFQSAIEVTINQPTALLAVRLKG